MRSVNIRKLIYLALAVAFWTVPAAADPAPDGGLTRQGVALRPLPDGGLTRQEVVDWLGRHGYTGEIRDFGGATYVAVQFQNSMPNNDFSGIYFYDCVNERCASIQYFAAFSGDDTTTYDKANDWNAHKRTIRAFGRPSKSITAETDVDISPGGSWELLDRTLTHWENALSVFKTFMNR